MSWPKIDFVLIENGIKCTTCGWFYSTKTSVSRWYQTSAEAMKSHLIDNHYEIYAMNSLRDGKIWTSFANEVYSFTIERKKIEEEMM